MPADHPLRRIKALADQALAARSPTCDQTYGEVGRPSIPPERLLKATLLMALCSVRRERLLCEELDGRTTRHSGCAVSQRLRKRVEEILGWTGTVACFRKTGFRGRVRTRLAAHLVAAASDLLRMAKLPAAPA